MRPSTLDSRYRFETPEAVELWYAPAGPVIRAQAWLRDSLVKLLFYVLALLVGSLLDVAGEWLAILLVFALEWFYPVLFEVLNDGMTPAKKWMGLRVVRCDGTPVGWTDSLVRNLLRVVDFLPFLYVFGLLAMMGNRRFQRLGDLVAGTVVVHNEPELPNRRAPIVAPPDPAPFALARQEQQAFIELAERSRLLSSARQAELAALVAEALNVEPAQALPRCHGVAAALAGQR